METKSLRCVAPSREWMAELKAGEDGDGVGGEKKELMNVFS